MLFAGVGSFGKNIKMQGLLKHLTAILFFLCVIVEWFCHVVLAARLSPVAPNTEDKSARG